MVYRNVYFRIRSGYKWGNGWACSNEKNDFNKEIERLFIEADWSIQPPEYTSSCPNAIKGKSNLYLHPMEVSGAVEEGLIAEVESILSKGKYFKHYNTDVYEVLSDMTDEEYQAYLEGKRDEIISEILLQFKTKRKNLYITDSYAPMERVREKFRVARLKTRLGRSSGDLEWIYTGEILESLIKEGKIVSAGTRKGIGYRTA